MMLLAAALAVATTGCFGGQRRPFGRECLPDACGPESTGRCESPERVVVQGPKTTCVVDHPPCPSPPVGVPAPSPNPPPIGAPAPTPIGAPGPMVPMGAPMMAPMMPVGFGGGGGFQAVNAQVRERTGLGFVIDYIRIPIPVLKPIPVNRPAEVTFQMNSHQQSAVGYAPVGMQMGGYAPVGMQMGGYVGAPVGMVAQPTINYGQVTVPIQVPVGSAQPPAQPPPPVGAAPPPKTQQELLDECMKKLEESQRKLKELEKKEPEKKEPDKK